jgi:hypothetical protein
MHQPRHQGDGRCGVAYQMLRSNQRSTHRGPGSIRRGTSPPFDLRDHNLNLPSALDQLLEPKGPRPAVPPSGGRPLLTADARARPLRRGPSADPAQSSLRSFLANPPLRPAAAEVTTRCVRSRGARPGLARPLVITATAGCTCPRALNTASSCRDHCRASACGCRVGRDSGLERCLKSAGRALPGSAATWRHVV